METKYFFLAKMFRVHSRVPGLFVLVQFVALAAIFNVSEAQHVNIQSISETCAANFITQDYHEGWEDRVPDDPEWKVRMASKLHIYVLALSMYDTANFRKFDEDHFKKACFFTNRVNGWSVTNYTGFGGRSSAMRLIKTNVPKVYRFVLPLGPYEPIGGTASVILSDNDLYTVFEFCFDNGLRTFAVFSRNQINDDRDAIQLHLKSIGFNDKHFVNLKPNHDCKKTDEDGVLEPKEDPSDLPRPGSRIAYYPGQPGAGIIQPTGAHPPPPVFWRPK